MSESALFTDFYELTMAQGYWKRKMNQSAVYDMFFRRQPFHGGFAVFAGLGPLLESIENFRFQPSDIEYLSTIGIFEEGFLNYLRDFSFKGDIWAMDEGTIVFPNEPLLRVHGNAIEATLIEGLVLNMINFQSLIATKTARIWLACDKGQIMEFGLRRAQGYDGAMSASRAAYIGGAAGTSNTLAAQRYGIPVMGTMAHSWVMSFPTELEAFKAYAEIYPDKSVFLIDTYNTLDSGIKSAITAGRPLVAQGKTFGVRLDSGDIQYLSAKVREALDHAGLPEATITVSNDLNEEIIESLVLNRSPIDTWGVGTHLVTGGNDPAFTGVYKLAARTIADGSLEATMKFSDNPEKTTNPGVKQVWRLYNDDLTIKADVLSLEGEEIRSGSEQRYWHPAIDYQSFKFRCAKAVAMLTKKMSGGLRCAASPTLPEIRCRVQGGLEELDRSYKRILNPHIYKVSLTETLKELKFDFLKANSSLTGSSR